MHTGRPRVHRISLPNLAGIHGCGCVFGVLHPVISPHCTVAELQGKTTPPAAQHHSGTSAVPPRRRRMSQVPVVSGPIGEVPVQSPANKGGCVACWTVGADHWAAAPRSSRTFDTRKSACVFKGFLSGDLEKAPVKNPFCCCTSDGERAFNVATGVCAHLC